MIQGKSCHRSDGGHRPGDGRRIAGPRPPGPGAGHGKDERSKTLQELGVEVVYGDLLDFAQVRPC